jgi:hypothetical protein
LVPIHIVYWILMALALNLAIGVGDLITPVWALSQPRNALFNDHGLVTTAYAPTII